jgi:uracil permease
LILTLIYCLKRHNLKNKNLIALKNLNLKGENMSNLRIGIKERPPVGQWLLLSLQHVFAMFGATILVPLLTGLDIGVALVASGIGTLIYIISTRGKVPVYLGSSFAYIGAIQAGAIASVLAAGSHLIDTTGTIPEQMAQVKLAIDSGVISYMDAYSSVYVGLMVVGLIYAIIALIIRFTGSGWIKKLLPPVVIGPMIIIIGLSLAPVAISSSGFSGGEGWKVPLVAVITFAAVVGIATFTKGFFKIVPFILAIFIGYISAMIFGLVPVEFALGFIPYPDVFGESALFEIPKFTFLGSYTLNYTALLTFAPIAFVTLAEHIGDTTVIGEICEEDFITDPGLDRTILGDGVATFVSAAIGGPANTTWIRVFV